MVEEIEQNEEKDSNEIIGNEQDNGEQEKRKRTKKPYPNCPFEESLGFAKEIESRAGKQQIRRLTLFDELSKSPTSGASKMLIINANKYGLTTGSYVSDYLQLTEEGYAATSSEVSKRNQIKARVKLAITDINIFNQIYGENINQKLPARAVLIDKVKDLGVEGLDADEAVDLFIENLKFVGLLKVLSGAERIISLDHLLDELPSVRLEASTPEQKISSIKEPKGESAKSSFDFDKICFYITPIGEEGSEIREHANLFYGTFIEPVVEKHGLTVIRADNIEKPGIITKQIIEFINKSKLVIADLSFNNPNVFYELAIRHTKNLPVIQIIRSQDKIPFDISQLRTIKIDCSSIYKLVPQIETYKSQISNQIKKALEDEDSTDNPTRI